MCVYVCVGGRLKSFTSIAKLHLFGFASIIVFLSSFNFSPQLLKFYYMWPNVEILKNTSASAYGFLINLWCLVLGTLEYFEAYWLTVLVQTISEMDA